MSDLVERLAAHDPVAAEPYRHPDLEAMISRVVSAARPTRASRWQRLQAGLGFGAIAATLVTALSIALSQGAAPLPALAIQRAPLAPSANEATVMLPSNHARFVAGASLSASAPSIAAYPLSTPKSPRREARRLARAFGLAGAVVEHTSSDWIIESPSGPVFSYVSTSVPQWSYFSTSPRVAPATESNHAQVAMPPRAAVESDATRYLKLLGSHYTLSAPSFSSATTSTTTASGAPLTVSSESVAYSILVDGAATDQSVSFTVSPTNALLSAHGPDFSVGAAVHYPLLSPRAGVAELNALQRRSQPASASPLTATLTLERVSLASVELSDHALWLVPIYVYSGALRGPAYATAQRSWSEVAISPSYVKGAQYSSTGISY